MRYAIYYCPDDATPLAGFGRAWLGGPSVPSITPMRREALLADVRRYGWHATLRAPMRLRRSADLSTLRDVLGKAMARIAPFDLPLQIDHLAGFPALRPAASTQAIDRLAMACIEATEPLREPLDADELARRAQGLEVTEQALLARYGYPYVAERYRFHMTLAAPALAAEDLHLRAAAQALLGDAVVARVANVAICAEAVPGADFELIERIPLEGRT